MKLTNFAGEAPVGIAYATYDSAGFDIRADKDVTIAPGETISIPTGLYVAPTFIDYFVTMELQIRSRSGLALNRGLVVANAPGTVDADYRDEICVLLHNNSPIPQKVYSGDRIAQGIYALTFRLGGVSIKQVRRVGGFGSTE